MNKRLLRFVIWSSITLAVLFQAAFLVELHSPLPSGVPLWSLSILSVACVGVVLLAQRSVATTAKMSYTPERVYVQHQFDAGVGYRAQGAYCVVLCRQQVSLEPYPRPSASTSAKPRRIAPWRRPQLKTPNGVRLGSSQATCLLAGRKETTHSLRLTPGTWLKPDGAPKAKKVQLSARILRAVVVLASQRNGGFGGLSGIGLLPLRAGGHWQRAACPSRPPRV